MSAIVLLPDEGKSVSLGPGSIGVVFKLYAADTGGAFALVEHPIEPGCLAPPHRHLNEDEYSYVLEGEVTIQVGEQLIRATPGTLVCKPRGIFHAFWNAGPAPARILEIIAPAGFEKYFEELAELSSAGGVTDANPRLALATKYGLEFDMSRVPELVQQYNLKFRGGSGQTPR
jgi:quercetin dioxygenase-like cupin family protein